MPDLENLDHRKDRVLGQVQHRSNPYKFNSVAFKLRYDCFLWYFAFFLVLVSDSFLCLVVLFSLCCILCLFVLLILY